MICIEYMVCGVGLIIDMILLIGKKDDVGMVNWGFVDGKLQIKFFWDFWKCLYMFELFIIWFYDLLYLNGVFYCVCEVQIIYVFSEVLCGVVFVGY